MHRRFCDLLIISQFCNKMMKSTNIVAALLIIAGFALISMPQMIGSANAQSEEASERACSPNALPSDCAARDVTVLQSSSN